MTVVLAQNPYSFDYRRSRATSVAVTTHGFTRLMNSAAPFLSLCHAPSLPDLPRGSNKVEPCGSNVLAQPGRETERVTTETLIKLQTILIDLAF